MFSFFKKEHNAQHQSGCENKNISQSHKKSTCQLGSTDNQTRSTNDKSSSRRSSLALLTQPKTFYDVPTQPTKQRSVNLDVNSNYSCSLTKTEGVMSSSHYDANLSSDQPKHSSLQRRFIREVVVERRQEDDQFDVVIMQHLDCLLAVGPGFFPQDILISLNDRNLESMPAEKVNRIIRSLAGRTLTVQVLSLHTHESSSDKKRIKRFGTLRSRQESNITKNNYWLLDNDGYIPVVLLDVLNKNKSRVRFVNNMSVVSEVNSDLLEKANDAEFDMSDDLSTLQFINETNLLHVLKTRSKEGYNCTFVGSSVLIVVATEQSKNQLNDNENSAILSSFKEIYTLRPDCLPPHTLSIAYNASRNIMRGSAKQSIVLVGSYISTKDEILRHTLKYLALAHLRNKKPLECCQWVDSVCKLISTACGAVSKDNFDCTVVFKMGMNGRGYACQFLVETLFLNRSKLFYRRMGSSKILSAIAYCDNPEIIRDFILDEIDLTNNTFLHKMQDRDQCQFECRQLFDSFMKLNVDRNIVNFVVAMAAIILHIGSCDISKLSGVDVEMARETCWAFPEIDNCSTILKIDKDLLLNLIFTSNYDRNSNIAEMTPLRMICGFATTCYNHLIEAVLRAINITVENLGNDPIKSVISVICLSDISDFSRTPPDAKNLSFSQLIDNYVTEKIHHLISNDMFDGPQKDLRNELPDCGIEPSRLYLYDPMQRLMEDVGSKLGLPGGLMRLLDHPFFPHEEVIRRIYAELWRAGDRTISVVNNSAVFCVYHFGSNLPVIYDPSDWYAVYKDLPKCPRFLDIFDFSERDFIICMRSFLFNVDHDELCQTNVLRNSSAQSSPYMSTSERIQSELKHLITILRSSEIQVCYNFTNVDLPQNDGCIRKQMRAFNIQPACLLFQKGNFYDVTVKVKNKMLSNFI
ncbi:hypothetical protein GJ496_009763 [Pomphorhynchus laevis]|nr:hypothetical protein GJ496_009763 [Pomphorhynchus laevis]